jgi:cephalosporin hydroxylase
MNAYTKEGFEELTNQWLKAGWQLKIPYTYSWLGFPILQIPDDMVRMQEVIFELRPDLIIETGVAHGGSAVFYASLCALAGHGRVIGIEKGLRCREAVQACRVGPLITLIEGDSVSRETVAAVHAMAEGARVLFILDSNHSKAHVAAELEAYHGLIQPGMYIVATDGNMQELADVPRGRDEWRWNNPQQAALEFVRGHPEFEISQPKWPFNESELDSNVTYWPNAWLRRI